MGKNNYRNRRNSGAVVESLPAVPDIKPATGIEQITGPIGIAPPPDYIFKYRKNRQAPAQEVWGAGGTVSYAPKEAKYIDGEGNFVYYYGVDLPSRTVAPVEAIHAMAGMKRILINALRFIGTLHKTGRLNRLCFYFNDTAEMMVLPFILEDGYYCNLSKEIRHFIQTVLMEMGVEEPIASRTGELMGMMFEYDNAYRCRLQDMMGETTNGALYDHFPAELGRIIAISNTREVVPIGGQEVTQRFLAAAKLINLAWYIPKVRRAIRKAVNNLNLDKAKMDDIDIYHNLLFGDYNTKGMTLEQRFEQYKEIHGVDYTKWPPRIIIKQAQ